MWRVVISCGHAFCTAHEQLEDAARVHSVPNHRIALDEEVRDVHMLAFIFIRALVCDEYDDQDERELEISINALLRSFCTLSVGNQIPTERVFCKEPENSFYRFDDAEPINSPMGIYL